MPGCLRINRKGVVYGCCVLAMRLLGSIFYFYYVKVFLDRYHMTQLWFQVSQAIFAIWNAINDPWFAYIQDNSSGWVRVRRKCLLYGAIPFSVAFLIPWFSWADYNDPNNGFICFLQGLTALCLFDTFFTFSGLAQCTLMTEYAESDEERLMLVKYGGVTGILGSLSVFVADYFSSGLRDFGNFQMICVLIAIVSAMGFIYAGLNASTPYDHLPADACQGSYWSLTKDIFRNRNFLAFVGTNFMQEMHITYILSFAKIFTEQMIPESELSVSARSFWLGSLMVAPQVAVVLVSPFMEAVGVYNLIMGSLYIKIVLGIVMYICNAGQTVWFMIYLVVDYTLADGIFTFFSIPLSNIADDDQSNHNRKRPIASMIFGSNALVVKPALSLSPMLVAGILDNYHYTSVKTGTATADQKAIFQATVFEFSCFAPIVVGIVQILIWRFYMLRGASKVLPAVLAT